MNRISTMMHAVPTRSSGGWLKVSRKPMAITTPGTT
jgi:hypothetical protein